jgi:hypothetical protein
MKGILRYTLAAYPEAVRAVRSIGRSDSFREDISVVAIPPDSLSPPERRAFGLVRAWRAYDEGRFVEAAAILAADAAHRAEGAPGGAPRLWPTGEAGRFVLRLTALTYIRLGRYRDAARAARSARAAYLDTGDPWSASGMQDLVERARWLSSRSLIGS